MWRNFLGVIAKLLLHCIIFIMRIGFGKKKSEESEAENLEAGKERPRGRWSLWRKRQSLAVPVEKRTLDVDSSIGREVSSLHAEEVVPQTRFTTQQDFKKHEVPTIAEGAIKAGALVVEPILNGVEDTIGEVSNVFVVDIVTKRLATNANTGPENRNFTATADEPPWTRKQISLDSVDVHGIPIGWGSLAKLGRAIQDLAGDRLSSTDLVALKPPSGVHMFLPMVASVIAHRKNPEIPAALPTQEQIKAARPWLRTLELFLRPFSEKAAFGLGKYVERQGERIVQDIAEKIGGFADFVGTIQNPREQLLKELTLIYKHLQARQTRQDFWGEEEVPIEEKIEWFVNHLKEAKTNPRRYEDMSHWLNSHDFPVLLKVLQKLNFPSDSLDSFKAGVAGAEFMQGIETFLRRQGVSDIGSAPQPRGFDLFDLSTWPRGIAEWFAPERLQQVKENLPSVLSLAYETLPTSGSAFRDKIYEIAENICVLHKKGHSLSDIVQSMFPNMKVSPAEAAPTSLQKDFTDEISGGATLGVIGGWVAVFSGASIIWIPIGLLAGALLGGVSGIVIMIRRLEKEAERKS